MFSSGECYSGKGVSTTYAAKGSSKKCKNSGGTKCIGTTQDCVGGSAKSNYVYKLEREYVIEHLTLKGEGREVLSY